MTDVDIPLTDAVEAQLRGLLQQANTFRRSSTADGTLPTKPYDCDTTSIVELFASSNANESTQQSIFEAAGRDIFYTLVASQSTSLTTTNTFTIIYNFLDLLLLSASRSLCDQTLGLALIEELLDAETIDGCRRVFDYLESRRERLLAQDFTRKKLIVLRCCNELLRRLSRAEDAVFCGRVFMFLFQSFPLGDKSAVNLRGEFHTENVTVFDEGTDVEVAKDEEQPDPMEVDSEAKEEEIKEVKSIPTGPSGKIAQTAPASGTDIPAKKENVVDTPLDDSNLYTSFWSLQRVFSDPRLAFSDSSFISFKTSLEQTLQKFKSVPQILSTRPTPRSTTSKRKRPGTVVETSETSFSQTYNPKYLTSRDLFTLEISDLTFQRHILVQSLITLDFLLSLTPTAKTRSEKLHKPQKALQYAYTLSAENEIWVASTRSAIGKYLQDGPDGKMYHRMVETVLARDRNWVRWKVESCPTISKPPLPTEKYLEAVKGAKRHCAPRRIKVNVMGAMPLDFLNDTPEAGQGLEKLKDQWETPDVLGYIRKTGAIEMDLEMAKEGQEKAELVEQRASCTWRVLRVTARSRLGMLDVLDEGKGLDVLDEEAMENKKRRDKEEREEKQREEEQNEGVTVGVDVEMAQNDDANAESAVHIEGVPVQDGGDVEMTEETSKEQTTAPLLPEPEAVIDDQPVRDDGSNALEDNSISPEVISAPSPPSKDATAQEPVETDTTPAQPAASSPPPQPIEAQSSPQQQNQPNSTLHFGSSDDEGLTPIQSDMEDVEDGGGGVKLEDVAQVQQQSQRYSMDMQNERPKRAVSGAWRPPAAARR